MIAYEDGNIFWIPPTQFSVLCDLDLTYWPFDEQKCYLKFGSWTHHGDQIDLVEKDKPDVSSAKTVPYAESVISEQKKISINGVRLL